MFFRFKYILIHLLVSTVTAHAQNRDSLLEKGREKIFSENYAEAAFILTTILKQFPGDTAALTRRGHAYAEMGKFKQAFADFNKVLKHYPHNPRALYWRAEAYNSCGLYHGAITDLDKLLLTNDTLFDSIAYGERGMYKENAGDMEGAIKDYEKAISLSSQKAFHYANLGEALCKINKCKEGIDTLSKAIALDSANASYYTTRGKLLAQTGNDSAAIADFDKAYALSVTDIGSSAHILHNRAECKYKVGDYAGCIRDLNIVSSTWGSYKELWYCRGMAKIAAGNRSSGCDELTKAKNLGNNKAKQQIKKNCR